jgi:endoglucanase
MNKYRNKSFQLLTIFVTLLCALFSSVISASAQENEPKNNGTNPKSMLQSYVQAMQPGWNMGNTFDATGSDETSWGNPRVTKEMIQEIAAQGYKSIRIPITWRQRMGDGPDYNIDPAFLDRIQEVVDWSMDAGLYVMINMHHDSRWWVMNMETEHDEVLARYEAAWTQIADRFKNHSLKLMFESINEPRFSDDWNKDTPKYFELLDELNISFHKIVRASGEINAVRPLVLPTVTASGSQARLDELYKTIIKLNDPNLIASIHYYGYWPFSVNIAGATRFDDKVQTHLIQTFDRAYNTFVAKGIPVILGEYGLLGFDKNTSTIEQGEKLKYFEFLTYYVQKKNITHMLWDNGQHFKRPTFKWADQELYNVMNAGWKNRSSTAETDLIFVKKGMVIQDTPIKLNLNGNQLTSIRLRLDGRTLYKDIDYTLEGDVLTLKASLLTKLTALGKFGENAQLTAEFNTGADWNFRVLYYETPKLQSIDGTTGFFAIPTAFNGARLAAMEAVYASGGKAGPQGWTSFKEFGYAFEPSYSKNEIKLLPAFFHEVKDGQQIILKFHFWSGEIVKYSITKNGTSILGIDS